MTIVKSVWESPQGGARPTVAAETEDSGLITHLGTALSASGIAYCQWKGHRRPDRWMSGTGDIDLLVERTASGQLAHLLGGLGFKRVATPPWLHLPGVGSYLGYDPRLAHLVHVHVHYRLVIGRPWNTTIVLPIERAVLASAIQGAVFRVPAPELELVLLVARVAQRYTAREAILRPHAHWLRVLQAEL